MEKNFLFDSLSPIEKKTILDAIKPTNVKAGDVVIKEGDDGDYFYLVESGELDCLKLLNPNDAKDTYLKTYVPGESFGELALLYNAPRAATIICKSESSELWALDRKTFSYIILDAV
jgi:cAMP-dependent protein kinase regulator